MHQRYQNGQLVSTDPVPRVATFDYDESHSSVVISIIPTLSPKKAYFTAEFDNILCYRGEDPIYDFQIECWPDNRTIKTFSVFRNDTGVEYRFISDHQDRL